MSECSSSLLYNINIIYITFKSLMGGGGRDGQTGTCLDQHRYSVNNSWRWKTVFECPTAEKYKLTTLSHQATCTAESHYKCIKQKIKFCLEHVPFQPNPISLINNDFLLPSSQEYSPFLIQPTWTQSIFLGCCWPFMCTFHHQVLSFMEMF